LDVAILTYQHDGLADQYVWTSAHLNDLDDVQSVADRAAALKALFDAALIVGRGAEFNPFPLEDMYELDQERIQPPKNGNILAFPFSDEYINTKVSTHFNPLPHFFGRVIFQARYDAVTREILSFLGVNGITWISLYAALDYLKHNGWDEAEISFRNLAGKSDLDRFRRTANNAAAIGPYARHGEQGWAPPKHPMTLTEATEMLLPVVASFLDERGNEINIAAKWSSLIL